MPLKTDSSESLRIGSVHPDCRLSRDSTVEVRLSPLPSVHSSLPISMKPRSYADASESSAGRKHTPARLRGSRARLLVSRNRPSCNWQGTLLTTPMPCRDSPHPGSWSLHPNANPCFGYGLSVQLPSDRKACRRLHFHYRSRFPTTVLDPNQAVGGRRKKKMVSNLPSPEGTLDHDHTGTSQAGKQHCDP